LKYLIEVDLTTEEREQLYWRKKEEKLKDRISEIKLQAEQGKINKKVTIFD